MPGLRMPGRRSMSGASGFILDTGARTGTNLGFWTGNPVWAEGPAAISAFPSEFRARINTVGSPTGTVKVVVKTAAGVTLFESDTNDVTNLPGGSTVPFTFTNPGQLEEGVTYRMELQMSAGDATNHLAWEGDSSTFPTGYDSSESPNMGQFHLCSGGIACLSS